MPDCPHNSRDVRYKNKFGAVPAGESVRYRLMLPRGIHCVAAWFVVHRDDRAEWEYHPMEWDGMQGAYSEWWRVEYAAPGAGLYWYHFEYDTDWGRARVTHAGNGLGHVAFDGDDWQLTVTDPSFSTPDWLKGGIIYQIFPDRFAKSGRETSSVPDGRILREDWGGEPEWRPTCDGKVLNNDFFGGDLKGIAEKLPYLASLGVTCLYLNPIFEAQSNHRYDTADYHAIDPLLGTQQDFSTLCEAASGFGIRILIDGVFSHTGSDSVYFNQKGRYPNIGAYQSQQSPYYSWYQFKSWPDDYESWWGVKILPEVREEDPSFLEFITGENGVVRKWLRAGASGWRLDVADELPDVFLDALRKAAKAEKKDALVLGEVWEDASNKYSYGTRRRYLLGDQLDSVMNYPFANAVLSFLRSGSSDGFFEAIISIIEHYPPQVLHLLMNHIGTHDTPRAMTALAGEDANGRGRDWQSGRRLSPAQRERGSRLMRLATVIQYTLPGVPSIYYGDEAGMEGYGDPFNRGCYPWGQEDKELLAWYRRLGAVRKSCPALLDGDFEPIWSEGGMIAFARNQGYERILTVVNRGDNDYTYALPHDWRAAKGLLGVMPWDGCLTLPPLSCALLGLGGWTEQI